MPEIGNIENDVLVGRDGYLFLAGGGHKVSDFVTGKLQVDPLFYDIFKENVTLRIDWAKRHGAQYLHFIMPDKQSIIPEAWTLPPPIQLGAGYVERNADIAETLYYPVNLLRSYKEAVVSRVDTHLTAYGSALVARDLVERLSGVRQEEIFTKIQAQIDLEHTTSGDLGSKLTPPPLETLYGMREPPGIFLHNRLQGGHNGGVDLRFNPQAPYQKRVAVFGDSFGRDISRVLQFWYGQVYFFRSGYFHPEIADLCKPDILITEQVERYLDHCLADLDRPHFLLFPYLSETTYEPSFDFSEALLAVLSYPRKRYTEFFAQAGFHPVSGDGAKTHVSLYDGASMADPAEENHVIEVLEARCRIASRQPDFVADLSGRGLHLALPAEQAVHGSYLVRRRDALLFGPNHLVAPDGTWSCETRQHKREFLWYMQEERYDRMWPGAKPEVTETNGQLRLATSHLSPADVEVIDTPVFLATPVEPSAWGRWIATVAPKVMHYKQHAAGRKFFCDVALDWQKAFLRELGLSDDMILRHDPGRTYICRDVMTVERSDRDMTVSAAERMWFFEMVAKQNAEQQGRKIFVSRLSHSRNNPDYRVLKNEEALASMLMELGFALVEPEMLPFAEQIAVFGAAEQVVCLGGPALFNMVFCAPGTKVITIESSDVYIQAHAELLGSLDLRYGVIFGDLDMTDPTPYHKRWTLDVARAREVIFGFFEKEK